MDLTELSSTLLVRYLGLALFLNLLYKLTFSFYELVKTWVLPVDLKKYGEWAVVTGSTDGIGKELSRTLAKKGLNIVLISRNMDRLKSTANEIEEDFNVKTLIIQADFSDRSCYANIEENIRKVDVGILVNNVGIATAKPFLMLSKEMLLSQLDVNCASAVVMTRMVIPQMKEKNKGMIVNLGSMASLFGLPGQGIYPATKSFLRLLSVNLEEELKEYDIKFRCLTPAFIRTKILDIISGKFQENIPKMLSFLFPRVEQYASYAVNTLESHSATMTGFWSHSIIVACLSWLPQRFTIKLVGYVVNVLDGNYTWMGKDISGL